VTDPVPDSRYRTTGVLVAGGALLVGAAAGIVAQRLVRGRRPAATAQAAGLGTLRGEVLPVAGADGTVLHVEVDPAPPGLADDGLTLLFTHGFALSSDSWHFQRRDLRGCARLVFWDQRGHGRSEVGAVEVSDLSVLAEDLHRVIAAACPTGEVVLVGHSMGAMVVLALADRQPELFGTRVRGVALLAGTAGGLGAVPLGLPGPAARLVHRIAPRVAATMRSYPQVVTRGRRATAELAYLIADRYAFGGPVPRTYSDFVTSQILATPIGVIASLLPAFDAFDGRAGLPALHAVETLVVVGDRDLMTPPQHSADIVAGVPGAEYELLPGAGHLLMVEQPEEVNELLRALIVRVRRNRRQARRRWGWW